MATNVSTNEELRGILSDVSRHRFPNRRQINPSSMLFQTICLAVDEGYLRGAKLENSQHQLLATFDLTAAELTAKGEAKLTSLTNQSTKEG